MTEEFLSINPSQTYVGLQAASVATNQQNKTDSEKLLSLIFDVIILITMFLCFFALSTNMTANLYEQSKEIGVLRSIGLTKTRIKLLYFYEAFVLVFASCLLGILVGCVMGYSVCLQQNLLAQMTLTFNFPWTQLLIIVGCSILCAFLSTFSPTTQLTKH